MDPAQMEEFIRRLAEQFKSNETLPSTWHAPDWEDIVEWWDEAVKEARQIAGVKDKP